MIKRDLHSAPPYVIHRLERGMAGPAVPNVPVWIIEQPHPLRAVRAVKLFARGTRDELAQVLELEPRGLRGTRRV